MVQLLASDKSYIVFTTNISICRLSHTFANGASLPVAVMAPMCLLVSDLVILYNAIYFFLWWSLFNVNRERHIHAWLHQHLYHT